MQAVLAPGPGPVCEMCSQLVTDLRTWLQSEHGSNQVTATLEQVGRGSAGITLTISAADDPWYFQKTEKAPTRAFSWLKAPTSTFTFKTLC